MQGYIKGTSNTICSKVLNYDDFVSELDLNKFSSDKNSIPCHCSKYDKKFTDKDYGHIITGNLNIIKDIKLKNLLAKGPNYREPKQIDFEEAKNNIVTSLNQFRVKEKITKIQFDKWKSCIMNEVEIKIVNILAKFTKRKVTSVLTINSVRKNLQELQDHFVLIPIDKAANNIALICKQYYASVIHKELKFSDNTSSNNTYVKVSEQARLIINKHKKYLKKLGIVMDEDCEKLPNMYWSPKMHKTPIGSRFIIASKLSSLKSLSQYITSALKVIFRAISSYYGARQVFTYKKSFWVIQSNKELLERLSKINLKSSAKTISTFDFSTLYTMIPHDKLIEVMKLILEHTFDNGNRRFICVESTTPGWGGKKSGKFTFNKESLTSSLQYLIENCYFQVGSLVFRQKIGIPMGSSPAPFLANLFLFHYEKEWIEKTERKLARSFMYTYRYIDDLINLNDGNKFEQIFSQIYPSELSLKKENIDNSQATFLD